MIEAFSRALDQLFTRPFFSVLVRSILLVIGLFVVFGVVGQWLLSLIVVDFGLSWPDAYFPAFLAVVGFLATLAGAWFLMVPITLIVASVFLEEIAALVEAKYYPHDRQGRDVPLLQGLQITLRFMLVVILVNIALLPTLLLGPISPLIYFAANAYLIGREYLELVALRHLSYGAAKALRRAHRSTIWISGAIVTLLLMVPFVNLLVPLFATAFMVHVYKQIAKASPPSSLKVASASPRR